MGRQKNDGRGRLGGRKKGVPNVKDQPLKNILRAQSEAYFNPRPQTDPDGSPRKLNIVADGKIITVMELKDKNGNPLVMSDYDVDMLQLSPADRVSANLRILKFHTPEMKSVDVDMDMNISGANITIESRLRSLCVGDEETN